MNLKTLTTMMLGMVFFACANYNSSTSDFAAYNDLSIDNSDPNFAAAYAVISNKCASCHDHQAWGGFVNNGLWVQSGYVTPGNAANSLLFIKIINNGGNMPQGGQVLSAAENTAIQTWINGITP